MSKSAEIIIKSLTTMSTENMCHDFWSGMSVREIASKYNLSTTTIRKRLKQRRFHLPKQEILIKRKAGMSINKLAKHYRVCPKSIKKILSTVATRTPTGLRIDSTLGKIPPTLRIFKGR